MINKYVVRKDVGLESGEYDSAGAVIEKDVKAGKDVRWSHPS